MRLLAVSEDDSLLRMGCNAVECGSPLAAMVLMVKTERGRTISAALCKRHYKDLRAWMEANLGGALVIEDDFIPALLEQSFPESPNEP